MIMIMMIMTITMMMVLVMMGMMVQVVSFMEKNRRQKPKNLRPKTDKII